jgi:hypothetical protein
MRAFYQAIDYIKATLESAPLLTTITHGTDIIDNVKKYYRRALAAGL